MQPSICRSLVVLAISLSFASTALAQFSWVDEKGNKQFSDQPPPASVPKNKILKFNGKMLNDQSAPQTTETKVEGKAKPAESLADREVAFKKRQATQAEKEKKEANDAKVASNKSANCKRMQEYKTNLDSGKRMSQVDAAGNNGFMSDEKRVEEQNTVNQELKDCEN